MGEGFQRRRDADWERTRWQTWQLLNIQIDPKDRLNSPADLLPLPGDAPTVKAAPRVVETAEQMIARFKEIDPDKFQ